MESETGVIHNIVLYPQDSQLFITSEGFPRTFVLVYNEKFDVTFDKEKMESLGELVKRIMDGKKKIRVTWYPSIESFGATSKADFETL